MHDLPEDCLLPLSGHYLENKQDPKRSSLRKDSLYFMTLYLEARSVHVEVHSVETHA